jgi:glycosyltransferase involved in cell wall biosynthesis
VICVSEICRANILGIPTSRVHLIHNAFETPAPADPEWRRRLTADLNLDCASRLIAFVGNLWKRKRPDFFIECCTILAAQDPQLRFIVFGREGDTSRLALESLASRRGIADRLKFAGFRWPPEANIGAVDLIAAPALREPFGRTLVEAALLGVPYVATADGGHVEIARRWRGGALVPRTAAPREFAAAILRTLHDPSATILPQRARQDLALELSPETIAGKVMDVYQSAKADRKRGVNSHSVAVIPNQHR